MRNAIRTTLNGKTSLSPDIAGEVIDSYVEAMKAPGTVKPWDTSTQREREVLKRVVQGWPIRNIGEILRLSVKKAENTAPT